VGAAEHRLLVVDDNEENRNLLARRLERHGFAVVTAPDGPLALEVVRRDSVDLVLLDWMMPGMDGMEVLRALRAAPDTADLPVLMVTAKTESADIVEALGAGANDYITKPVDFPVALARIDAQLRLRRAMMPAASATERSRLEPGRVLAQRYRLEAPIGSGSFGTVWRARHLDLEHDVALKVLQKTGGGGDPLARFRREGISACRVKHPNAVSVIDFVVTAEGTAFLVMELLQGHSFREEIAREGTLPSARAASVMRPVCDVLAEAHRNGVVHRDIKPSNIFIHGTAAAEQVKVVDFGIAKVSGSGREKDPTEEGMIIGTLAYMAPERFRNAPVDGRADVYSVGVTLYEAVVGHPPFIHAESPVALARMHMSEAPRPPRSLRPEVWPELEAVILDALEKDPDDRPTIERVGAALARAAAAPRADRAPARPKGSPSRPDTTTIRMADEDPDGKVSRG
jgi:CheY-like chemotaxis protein